MQIKCQSVGDFLENLKSGRAIGNLIYVDRVDEDINEVTTRYFLSVTAVVVIRTSDETICEVLLSCDKGYGTGPEAKEHREWDWDKVHALDQVTIMPGRLEL